MFVASSDQCYIGEYLAELMVKSKHGLLNCIGYSELDEKSHVIM